MGRKGKEVAAGKDSSGKRKIDDDKTGGGARKRRNRGVLQFFEDAAAEIDDGEWSDDSIFDDDFLEDEIDAVQNLENDTFKAQNLPVFPKEEQFEEEFDKIMEERYRDGSAFARFADIANDKSSVEGVPLHPAAKDPVFWKVKCMIGRERNSAFCLMQKFVDLKSLGNKLQIISAFSVDHVKGHIYVEADRQADVVESCRGLCSIYTSRIVQVPLNEVTHLLSVRSKRSEVSVGMWARVKNGKYKGDLAQVVAVNNERRRATVKLIPRIDLQAMAEKFGGGISVKRTAVPAPRLVSSSELEEFRPIIQFRRDRETGKMFEILDGLMLKDGYLYKRVSLDSLSFWSVMPSEEELLKFQPSENNDSGDVEWLTQLYGDKKKKPKIERDKGGEKGEGSSSSSSVKKYELYELVSLGRKDFGLIVGSEKDDSYKILKEGSEGSEVLNVGVHEIKSGPFEGKFTAFDKQKKPISVNDFVRIEEGPAKDKQGTVKQVYRGIIFLYNENEEENGGYICCKAQHCEKIKNSVDDACSNKGGESAFSAFDDLTSSPKSPLSPKKPWQARENNRDFNRGDTDGAFSVGQTLRIRVGPLKGYLCRVIAVRRSDITVKLDSQQKVLTVKSEHLAEVRGRSTAISAGENAESSLKPFGLLGNSSFSTDWTGGSGNSADGGWNSGGSSAVRSSWPSFPTSGSSLPSEHNSTDPSSSADAGNDGWDKRIAPESHSSWGKAASDDKAAFTADQSGGWGKAEGSWNNASMKGNSSGSASDSWGKGVKHAGDAAESSKEDAGNWGRSNDEGCNEKDDITNHKGGWKKANEGWEGMKDDKTVGWNKPNAFGGEGGSSWNSWDKPKVSSSWSTKAEDAKKDSLSWGGNDLKMKSPLDSSNEGAAVGEKNKDKSENWGSWKIPESAVEKGKVSVESGDWGKCSDGGSSWNKVEGGSTWSKHEGSFSKESSGDKIAGDFPATKQAESPWKRTDGSYWSAGNEGSSLKRTEWTSSWKKQDGDSSWTKSAVASNDGGHPAWGKQDGGSSWNRENRGSWGKTDGNSSWSKQSGSLSENQANEDGCDKWGTPKSFGGNRGFGNLGNEKKDDVTRHDSWERQKTFDGGHGSGGRRGRGGQRGGGRFGRGRSFGQDQSTGWRNEGGMTTNAGYGGWNPAKNSEYSSSNSWGGSKPRESNNEGEGAASSGGWSKGDFENQDQRRGWNNPKTSGPDEGSWNIQDGGSSRSKLVGGDGGSSSKQDGGSSWKGDGGSWNKQDGGSSWSKPVGSDGGSLTKQDGGSSWNKPVGGGGVSWNKEDGGSSWSKSVGGGDGSQNKQDGRSSWSKPIGGAGGSWNKKDGRSSWSKPVGGDGGSWNKQDGGSSWSKPAGGDGGSRSKQDGGSSWKGDDSSWNKQDGGSARSKPVGGDGGSWSKQDEGSSWNKPLGGDGGSWNKQDGLSSWSNSVRGDDGSQNKQDGRSSWSKPGGRDGGSWNKQDGGSLWSKPVGCDGGSWSKKDGGSSWSKPVGGDDGSKNKQDGGSSWSKPVGGDGGSCNKQDGGSSWSKSAAGSWKDGGGNSDSQVAKADSGSSWGNKEDANNEWSKRKDSWERGKEDSGGGGWGKGNFGSHDQTESWNKPKSPRESSSNNQDDNNASQYQRPGDSLGGNDNKWNSAMGNLGKPSSDTPCWGKKADTGDAESSWKRPEELQDTGKADSGTDVWNKPESGQGQGSWNKTKASDAAAGRSWSVGAGGSWNKQDKDSSWSKPDGSSSWSGQGTGNAGDGWKKMESPGAGEGSGGWKEHLGNNDAGDGCKRTETSGAGEASGGWNKGWSENKDDTEGGSWNKSGGSWNKGGGDSSWTKQGGGGTSWGGQGSGNNGDGWKNESFSGEGTGGWKNRWSGSNEDAEGGSLERPRSFDGGRGWSGGRRGRGGGRGGGRDQFGGGRSFGRGQSTAWNS